MNEEVKEINIGRLPKGRVKELADEAGFALELLDYQECFVVNKFARLILQDVLTLIDGKNLLPHFDSHVESEPEDPIGKGWWLKQETDKQIIKQHFGVEE